MAVKIGSFAKSVDAAPVAQAITDVGFTPKALILWTVGATTANSYGAGIRSAFGVSDGTDSGCVASAQDDATANTNTAKRTSTKAICIINGDGTVEAEASIAFTASGFTLTWSTNNATAYIINYQAFAGVNFTNAKVLSWSARSGTGDQSITGAGFQPAALVQLSCAQTDLDTSAVQAFSSIGFATGSGTAQFHAYWNITDNVSIGYGYSDAEQALQYGCACKTLDADGFTVTWNPAAAATYRIFSLCLAGGSYKVGWTTKSTSAAPITQTISSLGFAPEGVLLQMGHTGAQYGICTVIGAGDGTDERCGLVTDEYNIATIEAKHYNGDAKVLVQDYSRSTTLPNQVTDSEADLTLGSDDFGLTWTTNDTAHACEFGWFAFAGGDAENIEPMLVLSSGTPSLIPGRQVYGNGRGW